MASSISGARNADQSWYLADLLRHMGSPTVKLVEQAPDGIMMLAEQGEKIVQSRDFFAIFETAEEWKLTAGGRTLGTLPISFPVHQESLIVFAGQMDSSGSRRE